MTEHWTFDTPRLTRHMAWLRLLRIANLPSAIANILLGFLLASGSWQPVPELLLLILASACLYCAGMVLNDVFDFQRDSEERPERPLPSGAISRESAVRAGYGLLAVGVLLASAAGWISGNQFGMFVSGGIALLIAIFVWLYDGPLKPTMLAPWIMGACRSLNILLGASTGCYAQVYACDSGQWLGALGISNIVIWVALSVGVLIAGVTWLARNEARTDQSRAALVFAGVVILAGLIGLATSVYCPDPGIGLSKKVRFFLPAIVAVVSVTVLRQTIVAIIAGKPRAIQSAVVAILRSLIIFDACTSLLAAGDNLVYPLVIVSLVFPAMLMGRWVRST